MGTVTGPAPIRRRGAWAVWALGVLAVLLLTHGVAVCHSGAATPEPVLTVVGTGQPRAVSAVPDCAPAMFQPGLAVLDPHHAVLPPALGVVAGLAFAAVVSRQGRPSSARAPPPHARRLAILCVLRT